LKAGKKIKWKVSGGTLCDFEFITLKKKFLFEIDLLLLNIVNQLIIEIKWE